MEAGRGTTVLTLGILGLVLCTPLGIVAWLMGRADLKRIDAGEIRPDARSLTRAGSLLGLVAFALAGLQLIIAIGFCLSSELEVHS